MDGCDLIRAERERQLAKWSAEHDDEHDDGAIAINAAILAGDSVGNVSVYRDKFVQGGWGLSRKHPDRIERLVIAGALIAAEIDRLQRAKPSLDDLGKVVCEIQERLECLQQQIDDIEDAWAEHTGIRECFRGET